jgi:hypothetical protein
MAFRRLVSTLLICLLVAQPAMAADNQYRIPLKIRTQATAPGVGDGIVDAGDNPTPPVLTLSPNALEFDMTGGARDPKFSVLTNNGTAPTSVTGIASTADFSISHSCPNPLPVGVPCVISATPTKSALVGAQHSMPLLAPGIEAPAMLQLSTYARAISGPVPVLHVDPGLVEFGNTLKPGQTVSGSAIISNVGDADATLGGITSRDGFTVSSDCPTVLPAGQHCTLSASFSSFVPGAHRHDMSLTSGAQDAFTPLTFLAYVQSDPSKRPALAFDSRGLQFGILEPGASATKTAQLTNTGTAPAVLEPVQVGTPFTVTSDCPAVLAIGGKCTVSVTYTATSIGAAILSATAQSNVSASLSLDGLVRKNDQASRTTFAPASLEFGDVPIGQAPSLQATLTNTGSSPSAVKSITAPYGQGNFSQTNDCGTSLAPNASCTLTVTFKPLTADPVNAWVSVIFGDDSSIALHLSGTGRAAKLSAGPTPVQLGAVMMPGVSQQQTVGLGNSGNIPLTGLTLINTDKRLTVGYGNCTEVLQPNQGCSLTVQYAPDTDGPIKSSFQVSSSNGGTATVQIVGQAFVLDTSPSNLTFPATRIGASAVDQYVTLTNKGQVAVPVVAISIADGRRQYGQSNNCGTSLAAGTSCTIAVRYTPDQVKPNTVVNQTGWLSVTSNSTYIAGVSLTGTGVNPQLVLAPLSLNLPATVVGQTSPAASVTVTNPSDEAATVTEVSVSQGSAEFVQSNNCGAKLAAGASCTVTVQFSPADAGSRTGTLSVASSFGTSTGGLAGQGLSQLALSSTDVSFPLTDFGKSSAPISLTVTNRGTRVATFTGMGISQGNSDFGQSNNCGAELAPGAFCTVNLQFTPAASGVRNGTWSVVSSHGTYNVSLSGKGVPKLTLSDAAIAFPATKVGQASASVTLKVSNLSDQVAQLNSVGIEQKAGDFVQTSECGTTLAIGASCSVTVQFIPTATGARSGTMRIGSSFGVDSVGLTGEGTQPEGSMDTGVTPSGGSTDNFTHYSITFLDTEVGTSSAVRNIKFSNKGTGPLVIQGITQLGGLADFNQSNNCGESLAPGQACTISLLFTPSALGARTGQVVLLSETGNYSFDMGGKGVGAVGQWKADTSADFGDIAVGASAQRSFTFQNIGAMTAKKVTATLTGADVSIVSNACGTGDAPVMLAAGATCKVTVKYAPTASGSLTNATLTAAGSLANGPVVQQLVGNSPAPALAVDSVPDANYGPVTVETSKVLTFTVRNTSKLSDTLSAAPIVEGTGFSVTGGTCTSGKVLTGTSQPSSSTCTVSVTVTPKAPGPLSGAIRVASVQGASVERTLSGQAIQSMYEISGAAGSTAAPSTDFGRLTAGSSNQVVNYYYLRDAAKLATVASSLISLVGDTSFTVTDIARVDSSGQVLSGCPSTATGSSASCVAGGANQAIRVGVKFSPATSGVKTVTLHLEHNGSQRTTDVQLSGTGVFDATGAWSTSNTSTVALTAANLDYGTKTLGITTNKLFYVRNVGTRGAEAVGFTLSGDTSQFKIVSVQKEYAYYVNPTSCTAGGVIAADRLSATPCLVDDIATAAWPYPHIAVMVQFAPTAVGNFRVKVTPTTNNGTALPEAIELTGIGQFNPKGEWSTNAGSAVPMTAGYLDYGTRATGTTVLSKALYLRNIGTNGSQAVGFTLSGDTSQFRITRVETVESHSTDYLNACTAGGAIAANKLSSTPCVGADIAGGRNASANIKLTVEFAPTAVGKFSVVVTPTTNNGTVLPEAVTLTGTGEFNATGAWSTNAGSVVALTAANLDYGVKATGSLVDKALYVVNTGTYGAQAVGFTLSGDTSQFRIISVDAVESYSTDYYRSCTTGGVVAADRLSTTPCRAADIAAGRAAGAQIKLVVRFAPTAVGKFNVTVTPTTNNGTVLPAAVTLSGTGQ